MAAQARIVLLLCACSLALGSSIRPRGGPRPDYRTRRGPPPAVSNAPANSVPRVEFEDEHIALVYKPAGVALDAGPDSARFSRGGPPLGAWAARALLASNERDSLAPRCELFTTLGPEVGGLALFAKTGRCAAILEREVQATECVYEAISSSSAATARTAASGSAEPAAESDDKGVGTPIILRTSEAPPRAGDGGGPRALSLVRVSAMGNVGAERVAARLAELGLPVAGGQGARGFDGGIHLALASVILPPALAALRGEDATTTFRIEPPAKFMKTLRREALHAARHAAAAADAEAIATGSISAEASVDTRVDFLGVSLLVGRTQLTPRSSSECVVHACVQAATAAASEEGSHPRILDLGCGSGALMLAALCGRGCLDEPFLGRASAVGLDLDEEALEGARQNCVDALGLRRAQESVQLLVADFGQLHDPELRAALPQGGFHAIVCNPPFLRSKADRGRITTEATAALYAGDDGCEAYRQIAASLGACSPPLLAPGGAIAMQLPANGRAVRAVQAIFKAEGFAVSSIAKDER